MKTQPGRVPGTLNRGLSMGRGAQQPPLSQNPSFSFLTLHSFLVWLFVDCPLHFVSGLERTALQSLIKCSEWFLSFFLLTEGPRPLKAKKVLQTEQAVKLWGVVYQAQRTDLAGSSVVQGGWHLGRLKLEAQWRGAHAAWLHPSDKNLPALAEVKPEAS